MVQMQKRGGLPGANAMSFGKSNAKIVAENETGVTFKDVAGEEEAKDALVEIVDFLMEKKLNDVKLQIQLHKVIWDPQKRGV